MKVTIDTDELAEFYKNEWREVITSAEDLKSFLANFCKQKIEGEEEKEEPEEQVNVKADVGIFDGITYSEREQAQKHLDLLRGTIAVKGHVTIREYYRLAEFLQIIPKWVTMYFNDEYGWKDLSTVRINTTHTMGSSPWILEMPVPEKLDI